MNQNHIRVLPWPALTPDQSPIEYLLDELGRRVRYPNPAKTLHELRNALVHELNNILYPTIDWVYAKLSLLQEVVTHIPELRKPPY
jgi:transposase